MKAWFTDLGIEIASTGVQIHGGMGFIEETGAAQHLRDARILPIYEGTNGIQARDLVGRKVAKDGGETMLGAGRRHARAGRRDDGRAGRRPRRHPGRRRSPQPMRWKTPPRGSRNRSRASWRTRWRARCRSCGWPARRWAAGCWPGAPWWPRASSPTRDGDPAFLEAKLITARFYAEVILPPALAQLGPLKAAGRTVFALTEDQF